VLENIQTYHYAKSLPEAVKWIRKYSSGDVIPCTGSIDLLYPFMEQAHTLLDISRLQLDRILIKGNTVHLGGTTTLQQIVQSKELAEIAGGIINLGAKLYTSPNQRNITHLQDILWSKSFYFDLLSVLLVLDAQVKLVGLKSETLSLETALASGIQPGIVQEINFKLPKGKTFFALQREAITDSDISSLNVVVASKFSGTKCKSLQVAVGNGIPVPLRMKAIEAEFIDKPVRTIVIDEIAQKLSQSLECISDIRGSGEYKQKLAAVLFKRAWADCLQKAGLSS
jgi:CO/xanthine dehydrogenase FAD-binding subunit